MTRFLGVLVLFLAVAVRAGAQTEGVTDQLWADYHGHYFTREQREFFAELGARTNINNSFWRKYVAGASWSFQRRAATDLYAGLRVFYVVQIGDNTLEFRPWQGAKARWPRISFFTFTNYARLEERLKFNTTTWDADFALRLRYRLSTRIPLLPGLYLDKLFIPTYAEVFFDVGPDVEAFYRSEARFDIGVGYNYNDNWVAELHYIVERSASGGGAGIETTDHILRLQLRQLLWNRDYRKSAKDLPD